MDTEQREGLDPSIKQEIREHFENLTDSVAGIAEASFEAATTYIEGQPWRGWWDKVRTSFEPNLAEEVPHDDTPLLKRTSTLDEFLFQFFELVDEALKEPDPCMALSMKLERNAERTGLRDLDAVLKTRKEYLDSLVGPRTLNTRLSDLLELASLKAGLNVLGQNFVLTPKDGHA